MTKLFSSFIGPGDSIMTLRSPGMNGLRATVMKSEGV